jgi:hypothetical protein
MIRTFEVYVAIRDRGIDAPAAIGRLARELGRSLSAVEAAVMAPAKEDPLWKGSRPHFGLTPSARVLWQKFPGAAPLTPSPGATQVVVRRKRRASEQGQ